MIPLKKKNELLNQLLKLSQSDDTEMAHHSADQILLEILREEGDYDGIIEAYEAIDKWYA